MKRVWKVPPPVGTPIDWNNPLTRGLAIVMPFWQGHLRNIGPKYDRTAVLDANASWQINPLTGRRGVGASDTSTIQQGVQVDQNNNICGLVKRTMLTGGYIRGFENVSAYVFGDRSIGVTIWNAIIWGDATNLGSLGDGWSGGTNGIREEPELDHQAYPDHIVFGLATDVGIDRSRGAFNTKGRIYSEQAFQFAGHRSYTSGGGITRLGNARDGASTQVYGVWEFLYFWDRDLSEQELLALVRNPYQIFEPPGKFFSFADVPEAVRFNKVLVPWKEQPPPLEAEINRYHPLAPNVAYFRKPVGHGDMVSVLEPRFPTARAIQWRPLHDAQLGSTRFTSGRALPRIGSVTIYFRGSSDLAGFDTLLEARNAAGNTILIRKVADVGGDNVMDFRTIGNHDVCVIQEAGLTQDPKPHWVTYTWNQTGVSAFNHVYLDGVLRDSVATSSSFTEGSPFDTIDLGNQVGGGNRWDAPSNDFMWHDWQLSADEVRSLHNNPYQIFKRREVFVPHNEKLPDLTRFEVKW